MSTTTEFDHGDVLEALAAKFPTADRAVSEAAALRAKLTLPAGVVHVISDVHGEDVKLRHVINNASGALRQLVEQTLRGRLSPAEQSQFLAVLYYPREAINALSRDVVASGRRLEWVQSIITLQFEIVRALRRTFRRDHFERLLPEPFRELFIELGSGQRPEYVREMIAGLARFDRDWGAVRAGARLIRNLSCEELLVAGDLGDRGPRIDRVIDTLMRQPKVSVLWGNHDTIWIGAHLGHEPCMLNVLRFSARYRRAAQLEEGYGILTTPLERLVRDVYGDDPADHFMPKGEGMREVRTVARMQKALAIMQFKAEGRMIERHPEWNLDHRRLLHRIDKAKGTVVVDGVEHPADGGREHRRTPWAEHRPGRDVGRPGTGVGQSDGHVHGDRPERPCGDLREGRAHLDRGGRADGGVDVDGHHHPAAPTPVHRGDTGAVDDPGRPGHSRSMRLNASPSATPTIAPWSASRSRMRRRKPASWPPSSSPSISIVDRNWLACASRASSLRSANPVTSSTWSTSSAS